MAYNEYQIGDGDTYLKVSSDESGITLRQVNPNGAAEIKSYADGIRLLTWDENGGSPKIDILINKDGNIILDNTTELPSAEFTTTDNKTVTVVKGFITSII